MTVGIVGPRSWLAPHIAREFVDRGQQAVMVEKADAPSLDRRQFSALVLIAGRARPTAEEIAAEEALCQAVGKAHKYGGRLVYVSSAMVDRWERGSRPLSAAGERYVLGKKRCETAVLGQHGGFAVRLPPIFGPGQPLDSDMLVPSVATARLTGGTLELRQPLEPFELVHVGDAARSIADLLADPDPMPVRSVRSDLHQPLRLVSLMAPGIQTTLRAGWEWRPPPRDPLMDREPGQRHLTEVTYTLREGDLLDTMRWYEENGMDEIEGMLERRGVSASPVAGLLPGRVIDL